MRLYEELSDKELREKKKDAYEKYKQAKSAHCGALEISRRRHVYLELEKEEKRRFDEKFQYGSNYPQ